MHSCHICWCFYAGNQPKTASLSALWSGSTGLFLTRKSPSFIVWGLRPLYFRSNITKSNFKVTKDLFLTHLTVGGVPPNRQCIFKMKLQPLSLKKCLKFAKNQTRNFPCCCAVQKLTNRKRGGGGGEYLTPIIGERERVRVNRNIYFALRMLRIYIPDHFSGKRMQLGDSGRDNLS